MSINKAIIVGNLGLEPTLQSMSNGVDVTSISVQHQSVGMTKKPIRRMNVLNGIKYQYLDHWLALLQIIFVRAQKFLLKESSEPINIKVKMELIDGDLKLSLITLNF